MITIKNTQLSVKLGVAHVRMIIKKILQLLDYEDFDIGVWFTTNRTIQKYNAQYRLINKPTDILSFAYHEHVKPGERIVVMRPEDKNLGDLIISTEFVKEYCEKFNKSFENRLDSVIIHGICHLIGHTHEHVSDHKKMVALEKKLFTFANVARRG